MEYDLRFDNLCEGMPVTGSYNHGATVYKGVITQVTREDPLKPPYFVKLYKEYPEKSLWFYPWEIQSIDPPRREQPQIRPDRIPPGFEINPIDGQLRRIPKRRQANVIEIERLLRQAQDAPVRKKKLVDMWGDMAIAENDPEFPQQPHIPEPQIPEPVAEPAEQVEEDEPQWGENDDFFDDEPEYEHDDADAPEGYDA